MTKTLLVPDHVAQKMNKEREEAKADSSAVNSAYVDATEKVLDPSLLEKPLLERLPQPTGWRILVMPYQGAVKTQGGLHIPDEIRAREAVATVVAYVLKIGPLAYKDPNKFGKGSDAWCKEGQWVCIGRYSGSRFKIDGGEVRIINDDEVIATILEPDDIKQVQGSTMNEEVQEIIEEEEGVEIEVDAESETEEQEPETKVETVAEEPAEDKGDELESYSNNVQKRIKKLTEKYRKEERDREEAVRMAQQLLSENNKLKSQVKNLDKGYVSSEESRLEAHTDSVKRQYREAYESGDSDAMFSAQEQLSKMAVQQDRIRLAKQRIEREVEEPEQQAQPVAQQQAPVAKPDARAEEWANKNEWFGSDDVMTYAAFGLHKKLVEEEGFDPSTDEYYSEVDKRIRTEFPQKFPKAKKTGGAQVAPAGASATRSTTKQGRRSVKLSPSQIAMAKRLNVPLEEYAKFVKE